MADVSEARSRRSGGWRRLGKLLRGLLLCYLAVAGTLMWFEEKLIFPAPRYPQGDWQPRGFAYEEAQFAAADGTPLYGWYMTHPEARGELIYFHGNADCVAKAGAYIDWLRTRYRVNVLVWDYRGYGKSGGAPDEAGILADARAALDWVVERSGKSPAEIVYVGRSLGGAVAIDLAVERGAAALVLQNTFTSLPDVAAVHYWWLPVRKLMRTQFDSLSKIAAYPGPVLASHATDDEIVPFDQGRRLFEAAPGPKEFFVWPGDGHNQAEPDEYDEALEAFLAREAFGAKR